MTEEDFEKQYGFLLQYAEDAENSSKRRAISLYMNIGTFSANQLITMQTYIESCFKKNECQSLHIYNISHGTPEHLYAVAECIKASQTKFVRIEHVEVSILHDLMALLNEDSIEALELSRVAVDKTVESQAMLNAFLEMLKKHQKNITAFIYNFGNEPDGDMNGFIRYLDENKKLTQLFLTNTLLMIPKNDSVLLERMQSEYEELAAVVGQHPALQVFGLKNCQISEKILEGILRSKLNNLHFINVDFSSLDDKTLGDLLLQLANHPTIAEITFNGDLPIKNEPLFHQFMAQVAELNKIVLCTDKKTLWYGAENRSMNVELKYPSLGMIDGDPIHHAHDEALKNLLTESAIRYLFKYESDGKISSRYAVPCLVELIKKQLSLDTKNSTVISAIARHLSLFSAEELKDIFRTMAKYDKDGDIFVDIIHFSDYTPDQEDKKNLSLILEKITPDELFELYFILSENCDQFSIVSKFDNMLLILNETDLVLYRDQFILLKNISIMLKQDDLLPQELALFGIEENFSQAEYFVAILSVCEKFLIKIIQDKISLSKDNVKVNKAIDDMFYYLKNPSEEEYVLIKKARVLLWIGYFFNQMSILINQGLLKNPHFIENDFEKLVLLFSCLKEFSSYADPEERIRISTDLMTKLMSNKRVSDFFFSLITNVPKYKIIPGIALSVILANALSEGVSPDETEEIEQQIIAIMKDIPQFYKHGPRAQLLVKGIYSISQLLNNNIDFHTQLNIVKSILNIKIVQESAVPQEGKKKKIAQYDNQKTISAHKKMWLALAGLCGVKRPFQWSNLEDIECIYENVFKDFLMEHSSFDANLVERKMHFYKESFGQKELAMGLLAYWEGLKTLNSPEIEALFMRYIMSVLSENSRDFYKLRYYDLESEHLTWIFLKYPELYDQWVEWSIVNKPTEIEGLLKESKEMTNIEMSSHHQSLEAYFKEKIIDHHHLGKKEGDLSYLMTYFGHYGSAELQSKIFSEVKEHYAGLKEIPFNRSSNYYAEKQKEQDVIFQYNLLKLIEEDKARGLSDKQLRNRLCLLTCSTDTNEWNDTEFVQDLTALEQKYKRIVQDAEEAEQGDKGIKKKKTDYSKLKIALEDDYWGLFMCGTEVAGSCQRIYGSPDLNKCLLAYMLDGKNKLIAIRDEEGHLKARAILRLMLTDEGPALLKEASYPTPVEDEALEAVIDIFALGVAKTLQLSLFAKESILPSVMAQEDTPVVLYSLPNGIPSEYVDSNFSQAEKGEFSVPGCRCLFKGLLGPEFELISNAQALQSSPFMGVGGYAVLSESPRMANDLEIVAQIEEVDFSKNKIF